MTLQVGDERDGYSYIGGFVLFEIVVIGAALLRRRMELQKQTAAAAQPAH